MIEINLARQIMHKSLIYLFISLMLSLPSAVQAELPQSLEKQLIDALRYNKAKGERVGNSGKAIQAYMKAGVVAKKPTVRADYTDYYLLKKPASFMGHQLFIIEEEYMSQYIGCCVSEGVGVTVRLSGTDANLKVFAKHNGCSVESPINITEHLDYLGIKASAPAGKYSTLSCRDRDVVLSH